MNAEELLEYIKAEAIKQHAQYIKEYCDEHRTCSDCTFYNGTCRINDLPSNWDIYTTK